jgi:hypothetical protein
VISERDKQLPNWALSGSFWSGKFRLRSESISAGIISFQHIDAAEALHSQFLQSDFENNGAMKEGNFLTSIAVMVIFFVTCFALQKLAGRGRKGQPALHFVDLS